MLEMFVAEIQVETWTYIVADLGLLVDDQRGYINRAAISRSQGQSSCHR